MFQEIMQAIKAYDTIILHRHVRPDPDALGSQMGLKAVLEATFPDKRVLAAGQNEPSLALFGEMDDIQDEDFKGALAIISDTANVERIDDQRYQLADKIIKVDHHPDREPYGDISYVDDQASAACEIWAEWLLEHKEELKMTDLAARNFFLGIVGDTGRFLYDNTSPKTLQLAAQLRTYDFKASELMQGMMTESLGQVRLKGYVLNNFILSEDGLVNTVDIPQEVLKKLGVSEAESHNIVQTPGVVEGVLAWIIFVAQADGSYRCRIRSKGPAINQVAEAHNGGGHAKASGASVYSQEEKEEMIEELHQAAKTFLSSQEK
ncbi:DHH family phosphoesterase [Aerococcus christensenii]|uniref:DHHA1 domain protein n=1 Tax=Aerococcus christensenii TaxID=87541 RepID=A0A133XT76_9LACT|nr:bifunctional oligoribonuclease/PAP phosphatase NrnA [Aerococcus christensenii]KXB34152.1 DHHA1 domain protein [Aerococcus christensenii]MDK8234128.1 bifunctional oligoribonuclease/PAP phosphatase NrnA [Aerococcus christensenii]